MMKHGILILFALLLFLASGRGKEGGRMYCCVGEILP